MLRQGRISDRGVVVSYQSAVTFIRTGEPRQRHAFSSGRVDLQGADSSNLLTNVVVRRTCVQRGFATALQPVSILSVPQRRIRWHTVVAACQTSDLKRTRRLWRDVQYKVHTVGG